MAAHNFNLRGIPEEVMAVLKKEAKRLHTSINAVALKMIERGLGISSEKVRYHDLDHLAGSWSRADEQAFREGTEPFQKIDEDLWS